MMRKVSVLGVSRPYEVIIEKGALAKLPEVLKTTIKATRVVIITDDNVDKFYSEVTKELLEASGFEVFKFVFEHGEKHKTLKTVSDILEFMAENNITRSDCIVALGGGIVGDVSGYCAASFLRGIDFIQVPTTFLAAIDSSVGGKTGVNLNAGKNLAGAFYQPRAVICDTDTFKTLPDEIFREGIAEAIKYGVICDRELFEMLSTGDGWSLEDVIERCVAIKSKIVSEDEHDTGKRQLLNFGHTIGHAIEKCTDFKISHGAAVGIGMVLIAKASEVLGMSMDNICIPIINALTNNKLTYNIDVPHSELLEVMLKDKKRTGNNITLVIPESIGNCILKKVDICELENIMNNC